ncbi:carbohydrate kinase family protein [Devosia geojensis]|uniref:carbohydrate kinase family protein n=1 Tax=Devosia geojensis TaxID=443610 RepID=UPI000698FC59|nr:carbohydrate kinase family protein [Devosia geojensis]
MITPARNCDVLVAGEYFCDLIFAGLDGVPRLGTELFASGLSIVPGGTYNMALAATRLGLATRWCCDFGSDIFSDFVLAQARADGIDPVAFRRVDGELPRISAAFADKGERGFISYSAAVPRAPDMSCLRLHRPRWLLQTFRYEPDWLEFVHTARQQGAKVFLDCRGGDFTLETPGVRELIALADVFSPNAEEAMALAGTRELDRAVVELAGLAPVLLVKNGARGVLLVSEGMRVTHPPPAVEVVDTVGAGDAFNAGFIHAMIEGLGLPTSAHFAVLCGSISTTGPGSRSAPTVAELARLAALEMSSDRPVGRERSATTGTIN